MKTIRKWIIYIWHWIILFWSSLMIRISIGLYNSEELILKTTGISVSGKGKHHIRIRHKNPLVEKLVQGQRDEKFVKDYYEILKKAEKFLRNATPEKVEMVANKHGMTLGKKDKWGRRYEHYGFFDPSNKNYGKTLGEAMELEVKERTVKDDDYELEIMFDNTPIIEGIAKTKSLNSLEKARTAKFPMKIIHNTENFTNRIEQLTKYLHVKKVGGDVKILEFFIPTKFKVFDLPKNSPIFTELVDIKQVWIKDEYGGRYGYTITDYRKMIEYKDNNKENEDFIEYHIIKFNATSINNLN